MGDNLWPGRLDGGPLSKRGLVPALLQNLHVRFHEGGACLPCLPNFVRVLSSVDCCFCPGAWKSSPHSQGFSVDKARVWRQTGNQRMASLNTSLNCQLGTSLMTKMWDVLDILVNDPTLDPIVQSNPTLLLNPRWRLGFCPTNPKHFCPIQVIPQIGAIHPRQNVAVHLA